MRILEKQIRKSLMHQGLALATLVCCLLVILSTACHGACHVVRSGGGGISDGADWNNPLPDLPRSLIRGDVYFLAAGSYGKHNFGDPDQGELRIEIRAVTLENHCTNIGWKSSFMGQAIFKTTAPNSGNILSFTTDDYRIDGVYRSQKSGQPYRDWKSGYGFMVDNSNQFACTSDIGGGSPGAPSYVHDITLEYIEVSGSHDRNSTCTDDGVAFAGGSYNLTLHSLYVHDAGNNNFVLAGNHGHAGGGAGYGPGTNNNIDYSFISYDCCTRGAHGQACQCSEGLQYLTIAHNIFADIVSTAYIATASATGYNSGNGPNGPWFIYGNIFLADDPRHCAVGDGILAVWDTTFSDSIYFLNNTIANLGDAFCPGQLNTGFAFGLGTTTRIQKLYVENNLWWNSDPLSIIPTSRTEWNGATLASVIWSHNSYFGHTAQGAAKDKDDSKQSLAGDPFRNSQAYDFRLAKHTSPGLIMDNMVPGNNIDLDGNRRNLGGVWDRGALQLSK